MRLEEIKDFCIRQGFRPKKDQAGKLAEYMNMLHRWNRRMNLVGPKTPRDILEGLIADSLYLSSFFRELSLPEDPLSLDLGAGAGLPGIPLRTFWTPGTYYLIEIRQKRVFFLRHVLRTLELPRTHVLWKRVEDLDPGTADIVISRAFMPLQKLLPLAANLLGRKGRIVLMSGEDLDKAPSGWEIEAAVDYSAGGRTRYLFSLLPNSCSS
ncbi:MAG: 16S rRNA (guanine(527)-N(7))-methyltransferase RsmG [Desulfonatronovibrionaceae bacterium]